jgi:RNA polymerase primary sigma factor
MGGRKRPNWDGLNDKNRGVPAARMKPSRQPSERARKNPASPIQTIGATPTTRGATVSDLALVDAFFADLDSVETLTDARTRDLVTRARAGDRAARDLAIAGNLRLVAAVAARYTISGLPYIDLIQEGVKGLMTAVDRYDPARGAARFNTYATPWIRQAIRRIALPARTVAHVPEYVLIAAARVPGAITELEMAGVPADEITPERIKEHLDAQGGEPTRLSAILNAPAATLARQPVSLETPLIDDGETTIGEAIPDPQADTEAEAIGNIEGDAREDRLGALFDAAGLTVRQRLVLVLLFGLYDAHPRSTAEAASELGCTVGAVADVRARAFNAIRTVAARSERGRLTILRAFGAGLSAAAS